MSITILPRLSGFRRTLPVHAMRPERAQPAPVGLTRGSRRARAAATALALVLAALSGSLRVSAQAPPDTAIERALRERIEAGRGVAAIVGVIDEDGSRRIVAYRKSGSAGPELDANSVFEIGSITKAFTAILLAEMAERGEVALDDPVQKHLPDGVRMPVFEGGRPITLLDLAAQNSGLPRLPDNLRPATIADPYADYTVEQLYDFLNRYTLTRPPGAQYEYSNLAVGLLGHVLARRAGMSYEALVRDRILVPLGMEESGITLTPSQQARLMPGHNANLQPVPNWHIPTLAGAGALRSTVADMLVFLAANLRPDTATTLGRAIVRAQQNRHPTGVDGLSVALAWHVRALGGREVIWHNGGTGGYRSFLGYDPVRSVGAVILTNASISFDDLGFSFIVPAS